MGAKVTLSSSAAAAAIITNKFGTTKRPEDETWLHYARDVRIFQNRFDPTASAAVSLS
jgi:hypothetical protein